MASPTVSLVMAAYRPRAEWLRHSVGAALAQTDVDFELVVVDDGSPEPVSSLLTGISDARLRVVRREHLGHAATRNRCAAEAQGEYVRFIDADDEIVADSTARLLALARGREDIVAYGATVFCDEHLRPRWTMRTRIQGDAREACLIGRFDVRVPACLIPRAAAQHARWDERFPGAQDWHYMLQVLEHARVAGGTFPALLYRRHGGGVTSRIGQAQRSAAAGREDFLARHPEYRGSRLERRARGFAESQAARAFLTHGRPRRAAAHALRSALLDPTALGHQLRLGVGALAEGALHRIRDRR